MYVWVAKVVCGPPTDRRGVAFPRNLFLNTTAKQALVSWIKREFSRGESGDRFLELKSHSLLVLEQEL